MELYAKAGFDAGAFAGGLYQRRDPVSGSVKTFVRNPHARQSSAVLLEHQKCVRQGMAGKTFKGGDARADSLAVRQTLASVSKGCARGGRRAS